MPGKNRRDKHLLCTLTRQEGEKTMEIQEIMEGLWTFPVQLPPHGQFGNLNSFLIEHAEGGKNLLIDTGSDKGKYRMAFFDTLTALALTPDNTDVFITHSHSDHSGNVAELSRMGYNVIMGRIACEMEPASFKVDEKRLRLEGLSTIPDGLYHIGEIMACDLSGVKIQRIEAGDMLNYGRFHFECILTPGHTHGHLCLYDQGTKTMLLGDHVLLDTVTGICCCQGVEDALGDYLESLRKVSHYDVRNAFASHGTVNGDMQKRLTYLLEHHENRLAMVETIIAEEQGMTGAQIADKVSRNVLSKRLDETSWGQMYFELGETFAYLDHLLATDRVTRGESGGIRTYYTSQTS